jgi:hypothetical protein
MDVWFIVGHMVTALSTSMDYELMCHELEDKNAQALLECIFYKVLDSSIGIHHGRNIPQRRKYNTRGNKGIVTLIYMQLLCVCMNGIVVF